MRLTLDDLSETMFFVNCFLDKHNRKPMAFQRFSKGKDEYFNLLTKEENGWENSDTHRTRMEVWLFLQGILLQGILFGNMIWEQTNESTSASSGNHPVT